MADDDLYYSPYNVTRTTLSGVAAYRSALTLDWMAREDHRQRELVAAFETESSIPSRVLTSDCIAYAKPASGKVARLMLELLKNLEGDEGYIIPELIQALLKSKLLVETSLLDAEPDLDALVNTPDVMMGEPHTTFPRILAMVWIIATDPALTKKEGWCPITNINKYVSVSRPELIAKHMRALDPVIARARFIMEEFIQHVTPINVYDKKVVGNKRVSDLRETGPPVNYKQTNTDTLPLLDSSESEFMDAGLVDIGDDLSQVNLRSGAGKTDYLFLIPFVFLCYI